MKSLQLETSLHQLQEEIASCNNAFNIDVNCVNFVNNGIALSFYFTFLHARKMVGIS